MGHLAFFSPPAAGHINPTLGVVSGLVDAGHRVSFVTTERYASRIKEAGAEVVTRTSTWAASSSHELACGDFPRRLWDGLRETRTLVPKLHRWFRRERPDLVLFDGLAAWWGRLLAQQYGVPSLAFWPTFVAPTFENSGHWRFQDAYGEPNKLDPRLWLFALRLQRLASRVGLSLTELLNGVGTNVRGHLVFLPRSFQFAHETFGSDFHFVGPCLGSRSFRGRWRPPADDRPLCLVSLGTADHARPALLTRVVRAFKETPWRVVLAVGNHVDPKRFGAVPVNVEVHRAVPELEVLRRANLFITDAGMGSIMEALRFEVPIIAIPQTAEQRANTDRLIQLDLGRRFAPERVSPPALREAVMSVSVDEGIRHRVAAIRREMTETGGTAVAVEVIEKALAGTYA